MQPWRDDRSYRPGSHLLYEIAGHRPERRAVTDDVCVLQRNHRPNQARRDPRPDKQGSIRQDHRRPRNERGPMSTTGEVITHVTLEGAASGIATAAPPVIDVYKIREDFPILKQHIHG